MQNYLLRKLSDASSEDSHAPGVNKVRKTQQKRNSHYGTQLIGLSQRRNIRHNKVY